MQQCFSARFAVAAFGAGAALGFGFAFALSTPSRMDEIDAVLAGRAGHGRLRRDSPEDVGGVANVDGTVSP